eukprot:403345084
MEKYTKQNKFAAQERKPQIPENKGPGVVEFEDFNKLKKKNVRGLLRKRAKRYESDNTGSSDDDEVRIPKNKKTVVKSSFVSAFNSIINKKIEDQPTNSGPSEGPILAKYKRPAKEVTEEKKRDNEVRQKKQEKERLRIMGRNIPTVEDEPRERELQIFATKGVVQLFNAVREFQDNQTKEAKDAINESKQRAVNILNQVGSDKINAGQPSSNQRIIEQLQSRQSRWKVLEDDSEDEEGNIKVVEDYDEDDNAEEDDQE